MAGCGRRGAPSPHLWMRYPIKPAGGARQDISALLVGQLLKAGEYEVAERAEIARQLLDREVAPDHAPLRAEQVEEFGHDPAHFLFVAGIAEPAERRQLDIGMGKL